jgi:hypothetical protein
MQKTIIDYLTGKNPILYNVHTAGEKRKKCTHPFHVMQDNSFRVYFDMVSRCELGEMEQRVMESLERYPVSTAFELSTMANSPIRTCAARISDIFNDKKHRFPVKLIKACPDRKDRYTGQTATPWRLSRRPHYYTKSELIKFRKWTPVAITEFLQYPDESCDNPDESCDNPHNNSLDAPPMQLYLANRVWAIEATAEYKAYQKERKQKHRGGS